MEELSDRRSAIEDPFLAAVSSWGGQELQPHQKKAIDRAALNLGGIGREPNRWNKGGVNDG
jgi:hypothetical protein